MAPKPLELLNVTQAAKLLGINRRTVQRYRLSYPELVRDDGLVDVRKLSEMVFIVARRGWIPGVRRKGESAKEDHRKAKRRRKAFREAKLRRARKARMSRSGKLGREFSSNAGIPYSIESISLTFRRWLQFVEKRDPVADWDENRLQQLWREIEPMSRICEKVRALICKTDPTQGD